MQFHIQTKKDKIIVSAEVTNIEIADMSSPDDADFFCRVIRITGFAGEAIEVFCESPTAKRLGFHRVKKLKPVKHVPRDEGWRTPGSKQNPWQWQVYTGDTSDEREEQGSD
jgi:hypothetical protein